MDENESAPVPQWKNFGDWIADRQSKFTPHLSNRELGRRTGISGTHIGEIKKGKHPISFDKVVAIAHALNASEHEAFAALGFKTPLLSKEALEIARLLDGLQPLEQKAVINAAKAMRNVFVPT